VGISLKHLLREKEGVPAPEVDNPEGDQALLIGKGEEGNPAFTKGSHPAKKTF